MTAHSDTLQTLLDRFDAIASPDATGYRWAHRHDGGGAGAHLVFSSLIHGNEVGSLRGLVEAMEALDRGEVGYPGRITFLLGNPEAAAADVRFLEADLNRVFIRGLPGDEHEVRRARELMPLLDEADVYFDFHQTLEPCRQAFYIFPWGVEAWRWARAVPGARVWVTRDPGQAFSSGTMCADEFVRERGRPGITLELGHKGWDPAAEAMTTAVILAVVALAADIASGSDSLEAAAERRRDLEFFETVHREVFSTPDMALRAGLANFEPVNEAELLSPPGAPAVRAPSSGALLFPKYPPRHADGRAVEPRPSEIVRVIRRLETHPSALWP